MNEQTLNYFRTLGKVESCVKNATSIKEALHNGLQIILKECKIDDAVVWYEDIKGDSILHPYYWIAPIDLTNKSHSRNEGVVGRVYASQSSEYYLNYSENRETSTEKDFEGINIVSMLCVPLSNKYENLGCVQFINEVGSHIINEEEADLCEMLTSMIAISIDENINISHDEKIQKPIISVRNIEKSFKNGDTITKVLKGVNLDVYEGEFLAVLGESGCGKSTLLNIIGGLDSADAGTFSFRDKDMSHASQEELTKYRRDNIGFIFQSYNLMPNLNSKQNLDLIGELVDNPLSSLEALKLVGLADKMNNYPSQLSGGQQQRVSIARSLIKKPSMIFADEPTAALDYETSIAVLDALEKIAKAGTTLIMVTHNEEITRMANRVVRFKNGRTYEITINRHPAHAYELEW